MHDYALYNARIYAVTDAADAANSLPRACMTYAELEEVCGDPNTLSTNRMRDEAICTKIRPK